MIWLIAEHIIYNTPFIHLIIHSDRSTYQYMIQNDLENHPRDQIYIILLARGGLGQGSRTFQESVTDRSAALARAAQLVLPWPSAAQLFRIR